MKKYLSSLVPVGVVAGATLPLLAFAQAGVSYVGGSCDSLENIQKALCNISLTINTLVPILITLGVVYFIYGVISYVIGKSDDAKKEGRDRMIYGLIGLAVIVSIWGLVTFLKDTFGVEDTAKIQIPCIESPGVDCPGT